MDRVVRTDKETIGLTYVWVALSIYTGIALLGSWFPAIGKAVLPCLILSVIAVVTTVCMHLRREGHHRTYKVNIIIGLLFVWMAVMYFTSGLQMLWWVNYITQYDFISWTWVWVLLIPQLPLLKSYFRSIEAISWIGVVLACISLFKYTDNGYMQFLCEGFTLGAGLVVMTQKYHEKRVNVLCYVVLILGFLTASIHARRNLMLTSGCYLLVAGCQLVFGRVIKSSTTRLLIFMTALFALLCCTGFYMMNDRGMFGRITNRFSENTREYVYFHFAADFGYHPADLINGRGMLGTYDCPGVEGETDNDGQRGVVECGYLNNILKGGFIFLLLYQALMIAAIIRGFKSRNVVGKAAAWVLIFQTIDMVYFGIHSFNLKSFMIWMLVAACLNSELMQKEDKELQHNIYQPKPELPKWKRK